AAERQGDREDQEACYRQYGEPAGFFGDPGLGGAEQPFRGGGRDEGQDDQREDDQRRGIEDLREDLRAHEASRSGGAWHWRYSFAGPGVRSRRSRAAAPLRALRLHATVAPGPPCREGYRMADFHDRQRSR